MGKIIVMVADDGVCQFFPSIFSFFAVFAFERTTNVSGTHFLNESNQIDLRHWYDGTTFCVRLYSTKNARETT